MAGAYPTAGMNELLTSFRSRRKTTVTIFRGSVFPQDALECACPAADMRVARAQDQDDI